MAWCPLSSSAAGKIICMSSVHQEIPWGGHVNYATSKGGIKLMMESMAQELAPKRIRVNGIAPGAIRTPINTVAWDTKEAYDQLMTLVPYGRIGEPEDIARAAVWLASDQSDYVVGTTLFVDGGMTLYPALQRAVKGTAMSDHYDVIIIGSGPGGASVAHKLAPTGKRILLLERGDYLPRSPANWDSQNVFVDATYQAKEIWYGADGRSFHPGLHYFVGGNSKVYGAALFRLRERDFDELVHKDGVSPAWPLKYPEFEPYYAEAEQLFHVHGQRSEDPNEPPSSGPFPYPPVSHEPQIQALSDSLTKDGLHPFHLPLAILLDEKDGKVTSTSICIRCDAFDGFPCLLNGKADAQVMCVDPAVKAYPNLTLLTGAYVSKLKTSESGKVVTGVHVTRESREELYSADIVVVACGALSSALLLLRSGNDKHPKGLANGSDQVGRNYMRHNQSILMALMREPNDTVFQKTLAVSDYYFGSDDWIFRSV